MKLTDKRRRIRALVVLGLLLPVVTVHLGGRAVGVDGPIADTSISVVPVPGIEAPGHRVKYLARPNPIQVANGLALDGAGHLYIDRVLRNSIWKLNLASGTVSEIASDYEEPREQQQQSPDDMVFDSDGNLYVLEPIAHTVARIAPDGTRTRLPGQITDGVTVPNGIAFRENRLFVTEFSFDPRHTGGIWEVDPAGVIPAHPILTGPLGPSAPEGFDFAPDGLAYVPETFKGTIAVIDVDVPAVVRRIGVGGILTALKVDTQGHLVVLQADTGKVLRGDRITGAFQQVAQARPGLDNLVIDRDGTIYVSNFVTGEVVKIDPQGGDVTSLLRPPGPVSAPVSLNLAANDRLWVGDFKSLVSLERNRSATRLVSAFVDNVDDPDLPILFTTSGLELGEWVYFVNAFPTVDQRITRQHLATGERQVVARGFVLPTHLRHGPGGKLLACDQVAGVISVVDPENGLVTPLVAGLQSPSGLALDGASNTLYYSESAAGVVGVALGTGSEIFRAEDLMTPEGVALDREGGLLVAEGDAQRLTRIDIATGARFVVARNLPTRAVGITAIPGFNLSADVAVRPDGEILVSGSGDGSILRLIPR